MLRNRVWIYGIILFVLVAAILVTQVSWLLESTRLEERFLNQRVNMALCSAMDVLSKDKGLCSGIESCVSHGQGTFEMSLIEREKHSIDSVIGQHLRFYNIHVPFQTTFSPYPAGASLSRLKLSQALLFPQKTGTQNVLVHIEIPSRNQLIRSQVNGTFILSLLVLTLLVGVFVQTIKSLVRERRIRKESVDFINNMAHDLKTPISNISFAVSLLSRSENYNSSGNQFVSIIEAETLKLKERARKILGMTSVDAVLEDGSDDTVINVHHLIDETVDAFSPRLRETKNTILKHLEASSIFVKGNYIQLSSSVMNIIDNSLTYSNSPCLIQIRTRDAAKGITIEIEDNGPGIAAKEQALVFRKGYRIRNEGKSPEGFGLGLYLSKTFIEKHGGSLSLTSDGRNGSCFVIDLPCRNIEDE